jgi:predicted metalloprotease with PDZ domain
MPTLFRRSIYLKFLSAALLLMGGARLQAQPPAPTIRLTVDATQAPQKILHAHMVMPVQPGPLTLVYPKWLPGEHMPTGPILQMAGLKFSSGGKTIAWRRDLVDMYAFHLQIPQGATSLDIDFDSLLSVPAAGYSSGASATASLDVLSWNQLLLYPAGRVARDVMFEPSLRLPAGWKYGTALPGARQNGASIDFAPVALNTLVDSPVIAGKYFRTIALTPGENPLHYMDVAADSAAALAMPPSMEMHFHQLVVETGALFGSRHYRDYHFLVTLSDDVAHFGLEHHESSDDRTYERSFIDDSERTYFAGLLPHEMVHSWNGKYRRPADLATPDYQQPMQDDLLWVYEGLTEYLGDVLTSRSGLLTASQTRENLARIAAWYANEPGRAWRPLQDTADAAPFLYEGKEDWGNWRRNVDFYDEGELLWLDVDSNLRNLTNDQKSMNDFCKAFHGGPGGEPALKTYTFEDVVATLNGLAPYDWAGFLRTRLDTTSPNTPIEAIENSGWKLIYNELPNEIEANRDAVRRQVDLSYSIGLIVGEDGTVVDVIHGGPSYAAGLGPGMKIAAVNGKQFDGEALIEAVDAGKGNGAPLQLLTGNGAQYQTFSLEYRGGLRYPHIERDGSRPDYLSEILRPFAR